MLVLIGLGAGDADTLSRGAERALREASEAAGSGRGGLWLRTARHPVADTLREWGLRFETFDSLYESAADYDTLYAQIAERLLAAATQDATPGEDYVVGYAVPGHPLFAEESVRLLRERAAQEGIPTRVVGSSSFVEAALTAVGASLGDGVDIRDGQALAAFDQVDASGRRVGGRVDVTRGLLLFHLVHQEAASQVKLALMRDYPDEWNIALIRWAGVPEREEARWIPLFQLDRETVDHLTSVYVPPLPSERRRPTFAELVGIMARLRAPGGCPWDREQTHATLKKYFIEETYEVLEAIDAEDPDLLCEELGDALLQVVFHAELTREEGLFTIDDVAERIVDKLVRRHPHVFGDVAVSGSDEVLRNWEQIKRAEKTEQDANWRASILDGVPRGLPALMQAMEVSKRVVKVGFEWETFADVVAKLEEELAELKAELAAPTPNRDAISAELGDLLFTVVQIARWQKLDPEDALRAMLARFSSRFRYIEAKAKERGVPIENMTLAEMDALWIEAKKLT